MGQFAQLISYFGTQMEKQIESLFEHKLSWSHPKLVEIQVEKSAGGTANNTVEGTKHGTADVSALS